MNDNEILNAISNIFKHILEHDRFELHENTTTRDVDGWDSVTHMMIINEIEKKLNVKFDLMDLISMQNIGDLIKIIEAKNK